MPSLWGDGGRLAVSAEKAEFHFLTDPIKLRVCLHAIFLSTRLWTPGICVNWLSVPMCSVDAFLAERATPS